MVSEISCGLLVAGGPRAIPRWQLQANNVRLLALNVFHRGPAAAWEIYRLANGPWLDHRVSDWFFSRAKLEQGCGVLFPGCQLQRVGGRRGVAVIWDAPLPPGGPG